MKFIFGTTILFLAVTSLAGSRMDPSNPGRWASDMDSWYLEKKIDWNLPGARGATFTPDGRQAVISLTNGGLAFIDLRNQKVRHVLDFSFLVGHDDALPQSVAVSPLGMIAAAFPERHEIILIDRAKMRITERIKTSFPPRQIRFSAQGKFLFIGNSRETQTWPAIYAVQRKQYLLSRVEPMVADTSRDDRYLYLYDPAKNSVRWLVSDTLETVRYFPLTAVSLSGRPLSIRVLRDHRIAIGYRGSLVITDRYIQSAEMVHPAEELEVALIEPSHDNRFIVFGSGDDLRILSTVNNLSQGLALPDGVKDVGTYPNGNYLLYLDPSKKSASIRRIQIPSRHSSSDPAAIMVRN